MTTPTPQPTGHREAASPEATANTNEPACSTGTTTVTNITAKPPKGWATLSLLSGYQWFVFAVAALAWMADCMDQQLFNLARRSAMVDLLGGDPTNPAVGEWAGYATSVFLVGWAFGGLIFGILGDRLGRVRTLTMTILMYSIFTGLSALSVGVWDFCVYRFITGLGVGGVFAAAVALLAETMPAPARPFTLSLMQALSAVGNCTAALIFMALGTLQINGQLEGIKPLTAWRIMFLVGVVPAVLVIFIQARVREPQAWQDARDAHRKGQGRQLGSFGDLLSHPKWAKHALLGLTLSFAGVVGLWGIGFFSVDLQQYILRETLVSEAAERGLEGQEAANYIGGQNIVWAGITSLMLNLGAFFGMVSFGWLTARIGRIPAFTLAFVAAASSTAMVFWLLDSREDIFWMIPLMGFCQLALFGGYAIYLPELFPTRLRSTGTSFCYNVGRLVAAVGPAALGLLTTQVYGGFEAPLPFRYAGVTMCVIFLIGLLALPFLPETKDQPLPEDERMADELLQPTAPDWLKARDGDIRPGLTKFIWLVTLNGRQLYKLTIVPVAGRYSCAISATVSGKRLDSGKTAATASEALAMGLEELRVKLGW